MATGRPERSSALATLIGAAASLAVGVALRLLPFDRMTAAARWCARHSRRPATPREVLRVLHAIDSGARFMPFRVACLERSLAAVYLLGLRGHGVTWCQGVRTPPFEAHAWVSDHAGNPIGEPDTTATYQRLLVISSAPTRKGTTS
ncbi:lasso peptide biosynthesis B2 protein [Saccharothrix sp.]|uniref:lasso peptide biosynthesis B2 protein n=1 Tax=Saccharothrix sp. TaxID=1873460 RepID=UPI002812699B|nr:lasso peptide biosynthesis B2 protein [Saccharothrix sp.]